jgi:serine/threonine protein kinase
MGGRRWLKLGKLKKGGQGCLWKACPCDANATADQLVALKVPNPSDSDAERLKARQQLQHEIDILRKVHHEHIVGLVDADYESGTLATRLVDGPNLEADAAEQQRFSVAQAVQVGVHVSRALHALHATDHIHKDVKPANIVLDKGKRAVLIDFGLAENPAAVPLRAGGTPYYIAPEVFAPHSKPDARADVYSLAATLFRLLVGWPPHFQQCLAPMVFRSSRARLDELRFRFADAALDCDLEGIRRDVPRQLGQLICQALSADRNLRPSTVDELRNALQALRDQFTEATRIERDLWALSKVLLEAFRRVHYDADYRGKERDNAARIQRDLEKALSQFPTLLRLKTTAHAWTGIPSAFAVVPPTIKVLTQTEGLARQLGEFLAMIRPGEATELLNDLVVRTLEGIRATSDHAVTAAHDWRTVIQGLGVTPLPPILPSHK